MTYVLAWLSKDTVYIVADSATTYEGGKPPVYHPDTGELRPESTFLERLIYSEANTVVETSLKIIRIDSNTVLAYAGDLESLQQIREHLGLLIRLKPDNQMRDLLQECLSMDNYENIQLVIGIIQDGAPRLVTYNSDGKRNIYENEGVAHIGSLINKRPDIAVQFAGMALAFNQNKISIHKDYILTYMMTFIQTFGMHNVLLESNVGGIISGIELDENGARWPGDRSFLLYTGPSFKILKLFKIIYRHDGLLVVTAFPKAQMEMLISNKSENIDSIIKEQGEKLYLHSFLETESFSFMSAFNQRAVIVPRHVNKREHIFELTIKESNSKQSLNILIYSSVIADFLFRPLEINEGFVKLCN